MCIICVVTWGVEDRHKYFYHNADTIIKVPPVYLYPFIEHTVVPTTDTSSSTKDTSELPSLLPTDTSPRDNTTTTSPSVVPTDVSTTSYLDTAPSTSTLDVIDMTKDPELSHDASKKPSVVLNSNERMRMVKEASEVTSILAEIYNERQEEKDEKRKKILETEQTKKDNMERKNIEKEHQVIKDKEKAAELLLEIVHDN